MKKFKIKPFSKKLTTEPANFFNTNHPRPSKVEALGIIYKMLDKVMIEYSRQAYCKSGCKWCCNIALEILPIEAEYIQAHTDHKINIQPMPKLDYCPFLIDNMCSIYKYRPFNCRAFLSFESPDLCRDGKKHLTTGGPENGYGNTAVLNLAYQMAMTDADMHLTKEILPVIKSRIKDIREFFG